MSMSDCPDCWNTPCTCGHEYKHWSLENLREMEQMLHRLIQEKKKQESNKSIWKRLFGGSKNVDENAEKDST